MTAGAAIRFDFAGKSGRSCHPAAARPGDTVTDLGRFSYRIIGSNGAKLLVSDATGSRWVINDRRVLQGWRVTNRARPAEGVNEMLTRQRSLQRGSIVMKLDG
jgi:hypothetical protein